MLPHPQYKDHCRQEVLMAPLLSTAQYFRSLLFRRLQMNPFIESTVARPLAQCPSRPVAVLSPNVRCGKKRRSLVRLTLGAVGLATGLGIPPAGGLQAAGVLLAQAGILAAALAPGMAHAVDVNVATQEQLQGVRGIGPKMAQVIIEERARGGRYESFEDLSDRVKGIGPKKSASLKSSGLTLGGQGPGAFSSPPIRESARAEKASVPTTAGALPRAVKKAP
jgi:competence protein ComEA